MRKRGKRLEGVTCFHGKIELEVAAVCPPTARSSTRYGAALSPEWQRLTEGQLQLSLCPAREGLFRKGMCSSGSD